MNNARRRRIRLSPGRLKRGLAAAAMGACLAIGAGARALADDAAAAPANAPPPAPQTWAIHFQSTLIDQGVTPFHSDYMGKNSLHPDQDKETFTGTVFFGFSPWKGAEIWFNPEVDQGYGLSDTEGVAGFTNGQGAKVGKTYPYVRLPRLFLRQTINLGGESQKVDPDQNQLGGSHTANRLVLTVGKLSVVDIFDANDYAHDASSDFLNWSIIDTGSFDYAADAWGYTYGAVAELYEGHWTLRGGAFDLSSEPNGTILDPTFKENQYVAEIEHRQTIAGQDGKLVVTGFLTRGRMGGFADAIALGLATNTTPSTAEVRRYRSRWGVALNLQQAVTDGIGVFVRAGVSDGNEESYEYTDIDQTVAAGLSFSGKRWGRDNDVIGVAGVLNGISKVHEDYLADGGLGILVGDGKLPHPGPEEILETYYKLGLSPHVALTLDTQIIGNPAYNRDRGPTPVFSARLHAQF